jgi:hypothetical protein
MSLDLAVARSTARRLVGAASLRPHELPPAALLCVRRLADPLPGRLSLDPGALLPEPEWERAVAGALAGEVRRAARPARGAVPAGATAVLFADRAELLAALARDWLSGELGSRWWWRMLLRCGVPVEVEVPRLWQDEPASVPASLEALSANGLAVAFVERLPPAVSLQLARAVATAHGLEALVQLLGGTSLTRPAAPTGEQSRAHLLGRERSNTAELPADVSAPPPAPWCEVVPEAASPPLTQPAALLLGVALTLRRSMTRAAPATFADEVRAWLAAPQPTTSAARVEPEHVEDDVAAAGPGSEFARPGALGRAERVDRALRAERPHTPPAAAQVTALESVRDRRGTSPATTIAPTAPHAVFPPANIDDDAEPLETELASLTVTELGGLFMLLNVALGLGLYGDFTQPLTRGIALDPWTLVALLGEKLLGTRRSARDPVWKLLAGLADDRADFEAPRDWRLPRAWVEPFGAGSDAWRFSTARGRLRVQHPAGFCVVDVPLAADRDRQLARLMRRYNAQRCVRRALPEQGRWIDRLAVYVRARLELALGVHEERVPSILLRRHARVLVTDTRVDVVFRLADHVIEVRLAGLDRDPGWIPAARRDVRFHFE